jgi:hypothetical protein
MALNAVILVLATMATANAAGFLAAPAANASNSFDETKKQVTNSEVFQKKLSVLCQKASDQDACRTKSSDALFCKLMQRSKPDVAKEHCVAPVAHKTSLIQTSSAPAVKMADMKLRIEGTPGFKQETIKMAAVMGCTGVKKTENCDNYVQDVAFCLAFADQMGSFKNMDGVTAETEHCKHIDQKIPELAMLLQGKFSFVQVASHQHKAPEDELAKEMTHDLEMNFNKIAPFGKEDTAKELQDHAAKTQDTLVDAVENAEVAEIKRAVFRALTRLRAATIKEFDTIARLETQAIDAYNDAHHYRAENPLAHLHEDEAPVETDKLKSFH